MSMKSILIPNVYVLWPNWGTLYSVETGIPYNKLYTKPEAKFEFLVDDEDTAEFIQNSYKDAWTAKWGPDTPYAPTYEGIKDGNVKYKADNLKYHMYKNRYHFSAGAKLVCEVIFSCKVNGQMDSALAHKIFVPGAKVDVIISTYSHVRSALRHVGAELIGVIRNEGRLDLFAGSGTNLDIVRELTTDWKLYGQE